MTASPCIICRAPITPERREQCKSTPNVKTCSPPCAKKLRKQKIDVFFTGKAGTYTPGMRRGR